MNVYINDDWTFGDLVENAEMLKQHYCFVLTFFSYTNSYEEIKYRNEIIRDWKKKIYSLNIKEWQADKIWEYLNDYESFIVLKLILDRLDKKKNK